MDALSSHGWLLTEVRLSCESHEGFTVSILCLCVAVPRGIEELWQLCSTVHLWWLPGCAGSQCKQQSILQLSCVTGGTQACTRMNAQFFPTIYHTWPGIFFLLLFLAPILLSVFPLVLAQYIISPHMTILLWALITSLLIAPSAFLLRPPLPALSQQCLYTIAPVNIKPFHLETEMMCRCCYLLTNQKRMVGCSVCVLGGGNASRKQLTSEQIIAEKYKQKQYSSIKKNKEEMLSSLIAPRSVRVCSRPNLRSLSLHHRFPTSLKLRCVSSWLTSATRMHTLQGWDKGRNKDQSPVP